MSSSVKFLLFTFIFFIAGFFVFNSKTYAACTADPSIAYLGRVDQPHSVVYHLRLRDNCPGSNNYEVKVTHLPNSNTSSDSLPSGASRLRADWRVINGSDKGDLNTTYVVRNVDGTYDIDVRVIRDLAYFHPNGIYSYVIIKAELASNSSVSDSISLDYIVVNKPELIVEDFIFPGGGTCRTTDARVVIKNIGWLRITDNFDVRVTNGRGDTNTRRVAQAVSHNESINLSSFFRNMDLPPIGNYTAQATVDSRNLPGQSYNEVFEEDETNNTVDFRYTTSACPTVTPPITKGPTITITPTPTLTPGPLTITPGPNPDIDGWIQGTGGDMRNDNKGKYIIPAAGKFFSETIGAIKHGIVFLKRPIDLGDPTDQGKKANFDEWLVADDKFPSTEIRTSYAEMEKNLSKTGALKGKVNIFGSSSSPCNGSKPNCNLKSNLTKGVFTNDGQVTIKSSAPNAFQTDQDYIFLIKGKLRIEDNIIVPKGSTVFFIVSGNIEVAKNVTRIEGVYSTNNSFVVENNSPADDTEPLIINGSVIINAAANSDSSNPVPGALVGGRDLGDGNADRAGVLINYRPDFVLNAPPFIRVSNYKRQEFAPGE